MQRSQQSLCFLSFSCNVSTSSFNLDISSAAFESLRSRSFVAITSTSSESNLFQADWFIKLWMREGPWIQQLLISSSRFIFSCWLKSAGCLTLTVHSAPTISSHFCLFLLQSCWYCRCWASCKSLDNWYIILRSGIVLCSSFVQQQPLHDFLFFHFFFQQEPLLRFAFQLLLRFDSIYCGIMLLVPQYECTRVANCLIRSSSSPMVLVATS